MKRLVYLCGVLLFLLAFNACKKADTVGLEVLPEEDQLQGEHTDTLTVWAHIMREDSLTTRNTTFHVLGSHNDPIFGLSKASMFMQVKLGAGSIDFGANPQLDSIVMSLAYVGYYADIMKLGGEQSFSVHRVTEDMSDTLYYSTDTVAYDKFPLGTYTGLVAAHDSVKINGVNLPPQMRIRLSSDFGNELLHSTSLTSDEAFLTQLKGFFITPSTPNLLTGMGTLAYIYPISPYTRLTMYYHNDDTTGVHFDFGTTDATTFNHFEHDYTNAPDITAQLADSSLGMDHLYLQAMQGLKAKITFPHITNLVANGQKIAINRAELYFPVADNTTNRLSPPSKIAVLKKGTDGKDKVLDEYLYESADFLGGSYNETENAFIFNIPRHMQSLLSDANPDKSIYLRVQAASISGNRVVLNGPGNIDKPMKLKLTYTIIE